MTTITGPSIARLPVGDWLSVASGSHYQIIGWSGRDTLHLRRRDWLDRALARLRRPGATQK